nr:esterase-like activity of phytase family protein [uncultured Gellertiella sp.]
MRASTRPLVATLLAATLLAGAPVGSRAQDSEASEVTASPIRTFRLNSDETRFGQLEFLGGLVLSSSNSMFGAMSSIRFRPDGRTFAMVLDTGHWLTGRITRDAEGRLSGLEAVELTSMRDARGDSEQAKYNMDSEGIAFLKHDVLVSFERKHRVDVYPGPDFIHAKPSRSIPILMPKNRLKSNGSLETVAVAPEASPLKGAPVIVAERSDNDDGNLHAAILDGPLKGQFSVRHHDGFDVSDGVFLASGDLLLLERRFNLAEGIGVRIIRVKAGDIRPGAVVDGETILDADLGEQIDNLEGIDAIAAADGSTHLVLVSDDNHSLLQRSLMLEFRLLP